MDVSDRARANAGVKERSVGRSVESADPADVRRSVLVEIHPFTRCFKPSLSSGAVSVLLYFTVSPL